MQNMKNFRVVDTDKSPHRDGFRIHVTVPLNLFLALKESKVLTNIDAIFSELMMQYMFDAGLIEPIYEDNE